MNKRQLRDIVKSDNARRAVRDMYHDPKRMLSPIEPTVVSTCPEGIDPYLWDRGITGVPSAGNRDYKASDNCWNRGLRSTRTIGVAPGTEESATGATVLVISGGISRIAPISEFRPTRATRAAVRVQRTIAPEVAALPSIRQGETY